MQHALFRCACLALGAVLIPSIAGADPAAPSGWRRLSSGPLTLYRPAADPDVELRLHPADASSAPLEGWFDRRRPAAIEGHGPVTWRESDATRAGVRLAQGIAGSGAAMRIVMAAGCAPSTVERRYVELLMPLDERVVSLYAEQLAAVLAAVCRPVAAASAASFEASAPLAAAGAQPVPGALKDADIEGVLYSWNQVYGAYGLEYREWTYLLLKDGTVRRGVPGPAPADFNLKADRAANAGDWGRWRRAGGKIEVDFGDGFETPGGQMTRHPGRTDEKLDGKFEKASSAAVGTVSSWANWGLTLRRDGSFQRWESGGAGGTSGFGDTAVTAGAVYDDKGSASSVGGPNVGGGATQSTGVTDADLEGTYRIDGWTIELRYRSGRVQRAFFYTSDDREEIWFDGDELAIIGGS